MNDLIIIKQLPVIEENLKGLSEEINKKIENACSLVCNETTVKEVKKIRAELNKEFKELETQRKYVKEQIEKPYKNLEEVYKECISTKYKEADTKLANKINEVESELKNEKELKIKEFFEEYKLSEDVDFVEFKDANIQITLSASIKSLREQCKEFIDKIVDDLKTIKTQQYADEIEVEYRKNLDINNAIREVTQRHIELEKLKISNEDTLETLEQKGEESFEAPIEGQMSIDDLEEEEIFETSFRVKGTLNQLKKLKEFLNEGGYDYE